MEFVNSEKSKPTILYEGYKFQSLEFVCVKCVTQIQMKVTFI
jgi:hypothetical protein